MTAVITMDEIESRSADALLPPDPEFVTDYLANESHGRAVAAESRVAFVAIARNAMPWLHRTLSLVEQAGSMFADWSCYIHENDSSDDTKEVLSAWHDGSRRVVSLNTYNRPHMNTTTAPERTRALAEYRSACQQWVSEQRQVDYVVVFDTDPWGGWSVGGVATSVALISRGHWYGLASYSWGEVARERLRFPIHYDAFAARLNHWRQRDQQWFHHWHPAVGSPPVPFRSAFGQLAVYKARNYLCGTYGGEDCEHVIFHRSIEHACGDRYGKFGLNPSSRCVSFWVPHGLHDND